MKKKILFFVLLFTQSAIFVSAHDFEYNGIYYNIISQDLGFNEVEVTYKGNSYDEYINEYSGDIIIPLSFFYDEVNNVVLRIGNNAFRDCTALKSFQFGEDAFSFDFSLLLGEGIFKNCINLTTVRFSKATPSPYAGFDCLIRDLNNDMFYGCSNLTSFSIPQGVDWVGNNTFYGCSKLKSIVIPNTITDLDLYDCTGLTNVTVKSEQPWNLNCWIPNKEKVTLYVPEGCKAAYESADYWKDFKEIVEMRDIAFADDRIETTCIKYWDTNNDWRLNEEEAAAVTEINKEFTCFNNISSFDELKYFTGLKKIGDEAFYYCSEMTSITIPVGVTSIGKDAFKDCFKLKNYNRIVDLKKWCEEGDQITYGEGESNPIRTNISYGGIIRELHLFSDYNTEIKDLVIPDGISSICSDAFNSYSDLTSVTIGNSVKSIASGAFSNCSNLASVSIGNNVINIDRNPFSSCSNLNSILVEDGNSNYDSRDNCNAIIETNSNTLIVGCKNAIIPKSVTKIGNYAFYGCSDLISVTIPNSVTSIGISAFSDCSGLTSVTIGSGISSIGKWAFAYCKNLEDVYCYAESVPQTDANAFNNSYIDYATLHVPDASVNAYKQAEPWKNFKAIVGIGGGGTPDPQKCAKPTIKYLDGKIDFECETENAEFVATVTCTDPGSYYDKTINLGLKYKVVVYAKAYGYLDSDVTTAEIDVRGIKGDTNRDGKVTITDAVKVVNIILNNGEATAPALQNVQEIKEPE